MPLRVALKLICQEHLGLLLVQLVSVAFTRALVKGEKGQRDMQRIPIDTGTFFTILPSEILFEIGAYPEDLKARLELERGDSLEAQVYSVVVAAQGREDVTLAVTFESAQPVLGAKFLEDLGLKVNTDSGMLEPASHHGFAYNYEP
jgi:predicted aspartyl protease